jgi:hypothetical protein
MSTIYGAQHRAMQDAFDSRRMADRVEEMIIKTEITDGERPFIESRDMFFLSTIDHKGRPTVSYKGGDPGFLRVLDKQTIAFPSYDGNGMYLSMGNISANPEIGILLIDFEKPFRMRLQGRAEVTRDPAALAMFTEAELVVRMRLHQLWINCPRYVHRMQRIRPSRYVPRADTETPLCEWKRIDAVQDTLRPAERAAVDKAGTITLDDWIGKVVAGAEDV